MLKMFIHWAVGIEMGDVAAIMKVLPESPDTDVGKLKEDLRKNLSKICTLNKIEEQELAFGLKALRLEVIVPDEEGRKDQLSLRYRQHMVSVRLIPTRFL
jgi:Translation elongation factor EF-1beta